MGFDTNLWQAVHDSLKGAPGKDGANGKDGAQGPKGDPGPAGAVGTALDSFAGADDDVKLTAAMTYAAAQTYPPIIQLTNRFHQFNTKGRRPYRGLAVGGVPGEHFNAADAGDTHGRNSEIAFTFDSAVDGIGWFHATDTTNQDREVGFENLAIRDTSGVGGSHPAFLTQAANAKGYQLLRVHNLTTSGLWGVIGTLAQRLVVQGGVFTGAWHLNNGWSTDVHIAGSDNTLWPDGCLLDSPDVNHPTGAGVYRMWLDYLEKSYIGPMYVTARDKWGGIRVTGPQYNSKVGNNNGGPITIYGLRCEGHNAGDPSFGSPIRVEGGIVRYTDGWLGYGMSNPAATQRAPVDAGAVHVSGGALVAAGMTYDRAAGVAETVPMIYATGAAVVRVRDVLVGTKGGVWVGKPRVRAATSAPGSVTTDDSVTLV